MIQIDQLQIRIPGKNGDEGNILGQQVAKSLAETIPEYSGSHHIPELKIQLRNVELNDTAQLAARIAEQIIQEIKLAIS
ncbi:MAG: hypothetical protein WBA61_10335 [Aequorivita sp.]